MTDTWSIRYQELIAYVRQHGHARVPTAWAENPSLAKWVGRQRSLEASLSPERKAKLDALGFTWSEDMRKLEAQHYSERFQELEAFAREHGHCRVPKELSSLRSWVDRQRRDWDRLSPEWQQRLVALGFEAHPDEVARAQWNKMAERLERYVLVFGTARVPKGWSVDPVLAGWVARQRTYAHRLSPQQKKRLDALGFPWKKVIKRAKEEQWQQRYQELADFRQAKGHCRVPDQYPPNPSLGKWVSTQRHKGVNLPPDKRKKLEALGFVWRDDIKQEGRMQWYRMFSKLKVFQREHGHCRVPEGWAEDPSLAIWVGVHRQYQKRLPDWKRRRLDELGFTWSEQLKRERRQGWDEMFSRLQAFQQQHGHCRVTLSNCSDNKLFSWVAKQRRFPKRLKPEQVFRLNDLGFQWPKDHQDAQDRKWDAQYRKLLDFRRKHGHCQVPENWREDPALARWVAFQRKHEERLLPERKARLDELKFVWRSALKARLEQQWLQQFEKLRAFKSRFGHCRVPFSWEEDPSLGHWVRRQRVLYQQLTDDRRRALESLSFADAGSS